ncbi:MAG TPA: cellulase family glycosylhydrolase [Abditibacteriaceae bacterium]|jgi:hypothetical protein
MKALFYSVFALCFFALPVMAQKQHPSLPTLRVPQGAGVNIHFTDAKAGEMKMLSGAFRIVRMDLFWADIEKEKGVYDFSAYDRLMKSLDEHKVRALFILDYGNPLYDQGLSPYTDEGRAAFARWVAAAARHFKGRGILWELFNEPNISFWKPKPNVDDYIKLDKAVSTAIHEAAPGECYFGAATSTIDLKFLEACFQSGALERWDAVSVHPYRQTDPETASSEYRALRLLIERYKPKGKAIPILSGEWGYSTAWNGFNNERQGKYLPRQWMTNLMNEVPLSIWYDWHDDGEDAHEAEHNFGSVEFPYFEKREPVYNPKPSYTAAQTFVSFFEGYDYNKRLVLPSPDDYLLLFNKGDSLKLAVWTTNAAHEIILPASPGAFRGVNYLGAALPEMQAQSGGLRLQISDGPLYLEPVTPNDALRIVADWQRVRPIVWIQSPAAARVTLAVPNKLKKPVPYQPGRSDGSFGSAEMLNPRGMIRLISNSTPLLARNSPPVPLRITIKVDDAVFSQMTEAVVTNPLSFQILPATNGQWEARLLNPSGGALRGQLSLNDVPPENLTLNAGEIEKTLRFPRPAPDAEGAWQAKIRFSGLVKNDVIEINRRFQRIWQRDEPTTQSLARDYKAIADGDAKVASEQALSVGHPADGAAPTGMPSLKLSYRFEAGWKFANIQPLNEALTKVNGRPIALAMWVYGDNSNNVLRMRYRDATGQTFQPNGTSINWKGWRYYEFPLDGPVGFWGGANDGQIHYPIQLDSLFILDSIGTKNNKGEIYISDPMWVF